YNSVPRLMSAYRLDGAARRLMADMQKARFRAIAEQKCVKVIFGPSGSVPTKSYQVMSVTTTSQCDLGGLSYSTAATSVLKVDNSDFLTVERTADPVFNTRGTVLTTTTITLRNPFGGSRQVRVESTGRIRIV